MAVENFQNAPATDSSSAMSNSAPSTTARARRFAATPATNPIRRHRDRLASSALVITSNSGLVAGVGWKRPTMAPGSPSDASAASSLSVPPPSSRWRPYSAAALRAAAIAPAEVPPMLAKR